MGVVKAVPLWGVSLYPVAAYQGVSILCTAFRGRRRRSERASFPLTGGLLKRDKGRRWLQMSLLDTCKYA
jgi:hypothetical protein